MDETEKSDLGNLLDFDDQKVVTLGPPLNGIQRAVFDEISNNEISPLPIDDITQKFNEIEAYDDKFVDLREEAPLYIPRPYRNETPEATTAGSRIPTGIPPRPAQRQGSNAIGRTLGPVVLPQSPQTWTAPPAAPQPLPQVPIPQQQPPPSHVPQPLPPPFPPRLVTEQQSVQQSRPDILQRLPSFIPQNQGRPVNIPSRPQTPQQPIRPNVPKNTRLQPQQQQLQTNTRPPAESLRTGVCHSSIFYISSPLSGNTRRSFSHFAMTVSTDQCARTCHEFNCAIAHYDPSTGRCQFNPTTAFAIREGRCPQWPSVHFRNNVRVSQPTRIFCVQCHRPLRRGRGRNQGNRFRTTFVRQHFTGRSPHPFQSTVVVRAPSILSKPPHPISQADIDSKLIMQIDPSERDEQKGWQSAEDKVSEGNFEKNAKNAEEEALNEEEKLERNANEFTKEASAFSKLEMKKIEHSRSRTTYKKPRELLRRGSGTTNNANSGKEERIPITSIHSRDSDFD